MLSNPTSLTMIRKVYVTRTSLPCCAGDAHYVLQAWPTMLDDFVSWKNSSTGGDAAILIDA